MPGYCVVLSCKNKYTLTEGVSFHKFPYNKKQLLAKWIQFTGRGEKWFPSRWSSICSRHFLSTDFRKQKSRRCLRPGALPTILTTKESNTTIDLDLGDFATTLLHHQHTEKSENIHCAQFYLPDTFQNDDNMELDINESMLKYDAFPNQNLLFTSAILSDKKLNNLHDELDSYELDTSIEDHQNLISIENKPAITMKKLSRESAVSEMSGLSTISTVEEIACSLCGGLYFMAQQSKTSSNPNNVLEMIEKCFSSSDMLLNNIVTTKICKECSNNLKQFSNFVDVVVRNQKNLDSTKQFSRNEEKRKTEKTTPNLNMKIKQEPNIQSAINVKQEISENITSTNTTTSTVTTNRDIKCGRNTGSYEHPSDETIDQKSSQFLHLSNINVQQMVNNCDVMEIISLDDGFIELLDDDGNQDEKDKQNPPDILKAKIERRDFFDGKLCFDDIGLDHNYCKQNNDDNNCYKRECIEGDSLISENINISFDGPADIPETSSQIGIILSSDSSGYYTCFECEMQFGMESELIEHIRISHTINETVQSDTKIRRATSKKLHTCSICSKTFLTKLSLNNHCKYICIIPQKQQMFDCRYCQMKIAKWTKMRQHEKKCPFKNRPKIRNNQRRKYQPTFVAGQIIKSSTFQRNKCINSEQLTVEKNNTEFTQYTNNNDNCPPSSLFSDVQAGEIKPGFTCSECHKVFIASRNLKQHMNLHNDYRRKCPQCEKTFKHRSGLNQHKRAFHLKLKPHECAVCKRKFALKTDMTRCRHSDRRLRHLEMFTTEDTSDNST